MSLARYSRFTELIPADFLVIQSALVERQGSVALFLFSIPFLCAPCDPSYTSRIITSQRRSRFRNRIYSEWKTLNRSVLGNSAYLLPLTMTRHLPLSLCRTVYRRHVPTQFCRIAHQRGMDSQRPKVRMRHAARLTPTHLRSRPGTNTLLAINPVATGASPPD